MVKNVMIVTSLHINRSPDVCMVTLHLSPLLSLSLRNQLESKI